MYIGCLDDNLRLGESVIARCRGSGDSGRVSYNEIFIFKLDCEFKKRRRRGNHGENRYNLTTLFLLENLRANF